MTPEIALVLAILAISLVLFISEVIRMDLVALLVLGTLAITGLVDSNQAFAGFSNSAVITVWAMFILSEGLTRTGIADIIGRQVMRLGGRREVTLIFVIMVVVQRRDPNKERFWKVVVREGDKWRWLYRPLEMLDRIVLAVIPPMRLLCWNVVICAGKPTGRGSSCPAVTPWRCRTGS